MAPRKEAVLRWVMSCSPCSEIAGKGLLWTIFLSGSVAKCCQVAPQSCLALTLLQNKMKVLLKSWAMELSVPWVTASPSARSHCPAQ